VTAIDRRTDQPTDRRRLPRGGRRTADLPGQHPVVLIADSDDFARRPCVQFLARRGFRVCEVRAGAEGAAAIAVVRPHVVVVDAALPAARTLLPAAGDAGLPVIVMTTDFMADPVPAHAVLVKPFSLATMLAHLRRILRDREMAAAPPSDAAPALG
jgi:DNA-binding response OmpR family regulator